METPDALAAVEAELRALGGRRGGRFMGEWRRACRSLEAAGLRSPGDVPRWVWGLERGAADDVLRVLVGFAQEGDEAAVAVVLACLRPGLLALVARTGESIDDLVTETAARILDYPLDRRARVAAGLLLDVRKQFWVQRRRRRNEVLAGDTCVDLEEVPAPGELGVEVTATEELLALVEEACRLGNLDIDDGRLIIETRVRDDPVASAGARRGLTRKGAYARRLRCEDRLAAAVWPHDPRPTERRWRSRGRSAAAKDRQNRP